MLMKVIGSNPILTDAMRLELTMGIKIEPLQNFQCQLLKVEDINIYRRPLEVYVTNKQFFLSNSVIFSTTVFVRFILRKLTVDLFREIQIWVS